MLASLQMPIRNEEAGIGVDKEAEVVEPSRRRRAFVLGEDERGGVNHREDGMPSVNKRDQLKPGNQDTTRKNPRASRSQPASRMREVKSLANANPRGAIREGARWMLQQRLRGRRNRWLNSVGCATEERNNCQIGCNG